MTPLTFDLSINAHNEKDLFDQVGNLALKLRPQWPSDSLKFNKYTNGITNTVLCVQNASDDEKLVFRIYGNCTENIIDRKSELESFQLLGKYDIAPQVFCKFVNGFVVGHLPGETLTTRSVRDTEIISKVCEKLALMHRIPTDPPKKPFLFSKAQQFLNNIPARFDDEEKQRQYEKLFSDVSFNDMFDELKEMISDIKNTNQVLCHNDLLINNLLYDSNEVHIIDYEYTAVNYQLFDVANHFNEWAGVDDIDFNLCPNEDEKRHFVETYLKFYLEREPTAKEVDDVLSEIPLFMVASHLFWVLWALVQANTSTIDFDYIDYAFKRLEEYSKIKAQIKSSSK
ncbi:hypothetical protein M3Y97_00817700 [Aphelenchoides bicaudatus]|nr:hypothetical protein M3Y97_00817700 [Aphelenchoides bicaudatus]